MARTLFQEITHQIFSTPKKHRSEGGKPRNKDLEREPYKLKQSAFENKKTYEINKHL